MAPVSSSQKRDSWKGQPADEQIQPKTFARRNPVKIDTKRKKQPLALLSKPILR